MSAKAKPVSASVAADDVPTSQATPQKRPAKAEPLQESKVSPTTATSSSGEPIPRKKKPRKYASPVRETSNEGTTVPDVDLDKVKNPAIGLEFLREEEPNRTPVPSPNSNEWADCAVADRKATTKELFGEDDSDSVEEGEEKSVAPRHLSYSNAPKADQKRLIEPHQRMTAPAYLEWRQVNKASAREPRERGSRRPNHPVPYVLFTNETEDEYEEAFIAWMSVKAPHIFVRKMGLIDLRMRLFQYADARTKGRIKVSAMERALQQPDRKSAWAEAIKDQEVPAATAAKGTPQGRQGRPRGAAAPAPKSSGPKGTPSISPGKSGSEEHPVDQQYDRQSIALRPCCQSAAVERKESETAYRFPTCDGPGCRSLWGLSAAKAIDECSLEIDGFHRRFRRAEDRLGRAERDQKRVADQLFDDRGGSYIRILWDLVERAQRSLQQLESTVQQLDRRVADLERRCHPSPAPPLAPTGATMPQYASYYPAPVPPSAAPTGATMQQLASLLVAGALAQIAAQSALAGALPLQPSGPPRG